jgi:hypothetical protein
MVLMGLLETEGVAAKVLKGLAGVQPARARAKLELLIGHGDGNVAEAVDIPFTHHTSQLLQQALVEAKDLGAFPLLPKRRLERCLCSLGVSCPHAQPGTSPVGVPVLWVCVHYFIWQPTSEVAHLHALMLSHVS